MFIVMELEWVFYCLVEKCMVDVVFVLLGLFYSDYVFVYEVVLMLMCKVL